MAPLSAPTQKVDLSELSVREAHLTESELISLEQGRLGGDDEALARAHVSSCQSCRAALERVHSDDGTGATRVTDPMLGRTLGEYQVEKALARGGMGVVYSGSHPVIGKRVAIKVLIPDMVDPGAIDRLLEEARAVNAIRHPNIIDIFSFGGLPDGRKYFVMELLEGRSLAEVLQQDGPLKAEQVIHVLEQVMSALGTAHGAGVIHRDLKPANLFVSTLPDGTWHVTVLDFGLAKRSASSSKTSANLVMGTPGFLATEQITGKAAVPQTDLYAMGVVAWVLLTGEEPFRGESMLDVMRAHLSSPLPKLSVLVPGAPVKLVELVERLLAKDPAARPQSAMAVHAELRDLKSQVTTQPMAPVTQPAPSVKQPRVLARPQATPRPVAPAPSEVLEVPRSRTPIVVLSAVVVVLAILVAVAFLRPPAETPAEPVETVAVKPVEPVAVKPVGPVAVKPAEPVAVKPVEPVVVKPVEPAPVIKSVPPPQPQPLVKARVQVLEQRLANARTVAGKLASPAQRRLMNSELDELEKRLSDGERPKRIAKELDEVLEKYRRP